MTDLNACYLFVRLFPVEYHRACCSRRQQTLIRDKFDAVVITIENYRGCCGERVWTVETSEEMGLEPAQAILVAFAISGFEKQKSRQDGYAQVAQAEI